MYSSHIKWTTKYFTKCLIKVWQRFQSATAATVQNIRYYFLCWFFNFPFTITVNIIEFSSGCFQYFHWSHAVLISNATKQTHKLTNLIPFITQNIHADRHSRGDHFVLFFPFSLICVIYFFRCSLNIVYNITIIN